VAEPLPLPIELRWLAAFLLFILLPGWLLVSLLRPTRTDERLEIALLIIASGYSLAMLLGLALHAVFQPVAPWQIAAGGGLLVLALALAAARRSSERKLPSPQPEVSPSPSPSRPTMGPLESTYHGAPVSPRPHGPVRGRGERGGQEGGFHSPLNTSVAGPVM